METIKTTSLLDGQWQQIIISNGKGNIINLQVMQELIHLLEEFKYRPEIKVITIEGAGDNFSFGASVEEHQKNNAADMLKSFHRLFYKFLDTSIPTIAKVHGFCLGGGMELTLICNLIFADKTAKFGQPEIKLGVFAPPASVILPEKIGLAKAEEILLSGENIDANNAYRIGLVNQLFESKQELDAKTEEYIQKVILPKSAVALRYAVKASRVKFSHVLRNFLPSLENLYLIDLMESHDANEGIQSFLEKRAPVWLNQ
ncbi:MAG: enoyl-CoA hydratase-related protein [Bacteroidia bacterium]